MDFIFDHGVFECQIRSRVHFFFVQRLQLMVVFVLCCDMCDRTLFSFSSDQKRPMGEKLLQVKGGSKKVFVRGESEIFWTITGMVKIYIAGQFHTVLYFIG